MDKFDALFAKGGLSLDRLHTLCRLAEGGSLTSAAAHDPSRVSLFSRQLKELETFFGTALVRRRGTKLALTAQGEELARLAQRYLLELADFQRRCAGAPVELTLGSGASVIEWVIMPRLQSLRAAMGQAQVVLWRARSETLASRLRELQLDIAILREDAVTKPLKSKRLYVLSYVLYIPRRLAGPPRRLAAWLPEVPMIAPAEGWTRDQVDAAAEASGLRLRYELESGSATLAVRALREGHYGAILPEIAGPELAGADVVAFRPAFLEGVRRQACVAWHPRLAEARPVILNAVESIVTWRESLAR